MCVAVCMSVRVAECGRALEPVRGDAILLFVYACVWVFQIGNVLTALKDTKFEWNTIVVLWSDHGFRLGAYLSHETARVACA